MKITMKIINTKTLSIIFGLLIAISTNLIAQKNTEKAGKFELITLPYSSDALEPVISKTTIELHHGKHLRGYVNNLNKAISGTDFENLDLEEIVKKSNGGMFNNAGQTLNHNLYFTQFAPKSGGTPSGKLADAINSKWGSFEAFKEDFTKQGAGLFGSGWVWLAKDADDNLSIQLEANGSNPVVKGLKPILGFDLWEHAYYLDYQNKRVDHMNALWNIINWKVVENRFVK